jgi:hypothetical protein
MNKKTNFDMVESSLHQTWEGFDGEPQQTTFAFCQFLRGLFSVYFVLLWKHLGKDENEAKEVIDKLNHEVDLKTMMLGVQFGEFLRWWYKKPAKLHYNDENDAIWWDFQTIAELYNEWVNERQKEE